MAFNQDESLWNEFLQAWPLERLRQMTLPEYTTSGDHNCFVYWLEFRLGDFGSLAGGSAFKFGIFSRKATDENAGSADRAYDPHYAWYRRFGDTPEAAFEVVRSHVVAVAEAARAGRLEDIDKSELGPAYRWKIAFHYQDRENPKVPCIYVRKPLLHALQMPPTDSTTPQSAMYRALDSKRNPGESIIGFSERVWKDWVYDTPCVVKLSEGAIKNGYLALNLISAPFPQTMYGGNTDAEPGESAPFVTDTGAEFESDIRPSGGGSGRLRHRLGKYFKDVGASPGDTVTITQRDDGRYQLAFKKNGAAAAIPAATQQPKMQVSTPMISINDAPLNQILFGPPGTGKTYMAIEKALEILDPEFLEDLQDEGDPKARRRQLKARYDALAADRRIEFVTFHQSFGYEDFVEGIRAAEPDESTGQVRYEVADGVFKTLCDSARARVVQKAGAEELRVDGRKIWKFSLGDANSEGHIYEECIRNGYALMGFGGNGDFSGCTTREDVQAVFAGVGERHGIQDYPITAIYSLITRMQVGDLIVVTEGNLKFRAIGEVTGEYRRIPRDGDTYSQCRDVRWLRVYKPALPYEQLMDNKFMQGTLYQLRPGSINIEKLKGLLSSKESIEDAKPARRVLIIDEINRGNVSRIFGELITLIEGSKRAGADEMLEVVLPYSKTRFSVPDNVYLIGTMNTADRSLAGLDIALRRRFTFVEVAPEPGKLSGVRIAGVDLGAMLEVMNHRIEVLLGPDHQLGHAYFMHLQNGGSLASLAEVFRRNILPLLQEYFFEDWERIAWVLNDHRKDDVAHRFVVPPPYKVVDLFGKEGEVPSESKLWRLNPRAFDRPESYAGILGAA